MKVRTIKDKKLIKVINNEINSGKQKNYIDYIVYIVYTLLKGWKCYLWGGLSEI